MDSCGLLFSVDPLSVILGVAQKMEDINVLIVLEMYLVDILDEMFYDFKLFLSVRKYLQGKGEYSYFPMF